MMEYVIKPTSNTAITAALIDKPMIAPLLMEFELVDVGDFGNPGLGWFEVPVPLL